VSTTTDRPAVRPRSGRRPLPPLIFLLVLAIAALGVWWKVFGDAAAEEDRQDAACAVASTAPPQLDPAAVRLRVFNATDRAGLAQLVAADLQNRGFTVEDVANDPTDREVTGVGEIRHGHPGTGAASYMTIYLPGATDFLDTRATELVDVVVGPEYAGLSSAEDVAAQLDPAASAAAACDTAA
jgi:hypothetical protein